MDSHALTARELHSQTKSAQKAKKLDLGIPDRHEALNRSVDNISQEDEFGISDNGKANATMPEGQLNQDDDEVFDENFFYGGSPNKSGLQTGRQSQPFGRNSINNLEIHMNRTSDQMIIEKQHSELDSLKQLRMQNLTSLVNNPKRDTFFNKLGSVVKNKIDSKRNVHNKGYQQRQIYKPLTEKDVPDNSHIPRVKEKELSRHIQSHKVLASNYLIKREEQEKQRMVQLQREIHATKQSPFEVRKQIDDKKVQSARSQSQKSINADDIIVPNEFFDPNYKIDPSLLMLTSPDEIKPYIDKHQKYLDNLNADLEIKILKNFDFFNKSFHKFDEMKDDMKIVSQKSQLIRTAHQKLKYFQLCNMIKLYRLQRKRINTNRVSDILRSLTALQQSVPVIDNLITNAQKASNNQNTKESTQNFQLGLQLIAHANDLINNKLSGIAVTECYRDKLIRLKGQCCKKIEESCVSQVDNFLKQQILHRNFGNKPEPENTTQLCSIINDIIQSSKIKDMQSSNRSVNNSEMYEYMMQSIAQNWSLFDFSKVQEGNLMNAMANFPVLSDVFLDGNDKLQTNNVQQDYVSSISNTVGVNLDILIRDIKRKHQELLKQGNFQILEQIQQLTNDLSEEAYKNRVSIAPISAQVANENPDSIVAARTCQRPKLILQFITKCIVHLYQVDLMPDFPISNNDMLDRLESKLKYRTKLMELLLSGFVLQTILVYQMSRAFELIEIWIIDSVKQWQQKQKESQQYLLLHTRDQKQIQRKHELVLGQILDQFAEQKTQLSSLMQKNFDKGFLVIIDQEQHAKNEANGNDQKVSGSSGLLQFLISYFRPPAEEASKIQKYNDFQLRCHNQLNEQRKNDFFKVCLTFQNLTSWLSGTRQEEYLRSLKQSNKKNQNPIIKFQPTSIQAQLQDIQKQFVTLYKEQVIQRVLGYLDNQEKFVRCKTIDEEDEVGVVARILSPDFIVNVDIKPIDKQYPSDTLHVPEVFDFVAENQMNSQEQQQQDILKIEDEVVQIKGKPLPKAGFKILASLVFLNKQLDQFIQTVEFELPQQRQQRTAFDLIHTLEIINQFNTNLKDQIIGCGAFYSKRVDKITAKHLALVQNSTRFIQNVILPSLCKNIFQNESRKQGANSRKLMITQFEEVYKELQSHIKEIRLKFIQIIIDQVQKKIEEAAKLDWDKQINKGELIQASKHITDIQSTLSQMFKVLQSNLSLEVSDIEDEIMQGALERIFELLERLYIESTKESYSKYAKKRIKVDMKILLKNLESDAILKFNPIFTYLHFDLLVSMDREDLQEKIDAGEEPETELARIQVVDHYSKIKQSIKNILINRCAVKLDELNQFCRFQKQEQAAQLERQKTLEPENTALEAPPRLEKSKTTLPAQDAIEDDSGKPEDVPTETVQKEEAVQIIKEEEVTEQEEKVVVQEMQSQLEPAQDSNQVPVAESMETDKQIEQKLEAEAQPSFEQTASTNEGTVSAAPQEGSSVKDITHVGENAPDEHLDEKQTSSQSNVSAEDKQAPVMKNPSPGKLGGLGLLDLSKVEAQKQADEAAIQQEAEDNEDPSAQSPTKTTAPLVSDRELEEIFQKKEEQRKQGQKKVVRSLWSARKSKREEEEPADGTEESEPAVEKLQDSQDNQVDPPDESKVNNESVQEPVDAKKAESPQNKEEGETNEEEPEQQ